MGKISVGDDDVEVSRSDEGVHNEVIAKILLSALAGMK